MRAGSLSRFALTRGLWTICLALLCTTIGMTCVQAMAATAGDVVVAGGNSTAGPTDTIEIFNPTNGQFTSAGTLGVPSMGLAAHALPDNTILLAGGFNGSTYLANAYVYYSNSAPSNATKATGSMGTGREHFALVQMQNNKILVMGGMTNTGVTNTAEIYDTKAGTFSPAANMTMARENAAAVVLNNGNVLICGGDDGNGTVLNSTEIYDPKTNTWTTSGNLNTARSHFTATVVSGGSIGGYVLAAGGQDSSGNTLSSAELFDPSKGTWTGAGNMNTPRENQTATVLKNNTVLLAGGGVRFGSVTAVDNAELFDPATVSFNTITAYMNQPRENHTATLLTDGTVLIAGGDDGQNPTNTAEIYDPTAQTFTSTGSMATARTDQAAALVEGSAAPGYNNNNVGGGLSLYAFLAFILMWTLFGLWRYTARRHGA